jgi:hypothetical protein
MVVFISEWFIRTARKRRTHQSSSKSEEFHVMKFEDMKKPSGFFESIF